MTKSVFVLWSAKYPSEDIDAIIDQYLKDPRDAANLYDEMTKALDELAKVCIRRSQEAQLSLEWVDRGTYAKGQQIWTLFLIYLANSYLA